MKGVVAFQLGLGSIHRTTLQLLLLLLLLGSELLVGLLERALGFVREARVRGRRSDGRGDRRRRDRDRGAQRSKRRRRGTKGRPRSARTQRAFEVGRWTAFHIAVRLVKPNTAAPITATAANQPRRDRRRGRKLTASRSKSMSPISAATGAVLRGPMEYGAGRVRRARLRKARGRLGFGVEPRHLGECGPTRAALFPNERAFVDQTVLERVVQEVQRHHADVAGGQLDVPDIIVGGVVHRTRTVTRRSRRTQNRLRKATDFRAAIKDSTALAYSYVQGTGWISSLTMDVSAQPPSPPASGAPASGQAEMCASVCRPGMSSGS